MVQFAKKLAAAQLPEWKGHYLEYKQLKKKLKKVVKTTTSQDGSDDEQLHQLALGNTDGVVSQEGFQRALDAEVEKVVLFFLKKQGEFAETLAELRTRQCLLQKDDLEAMHSLADMYRKVGDELVKLLQFVELNATGLRKILKKHDKKIKELTIMGTYLSSRADSQASHLQQLYHDEGISAIIATIRTALTELRRREIDLASDAAGTTLFRSISEVEPVLNKVSLARRRLHQSTQYVVKTIAAQALIFDSDLSEDEDEATYESFKRLRVSEVSRFINMMCTALYMANYYIVAPTSGDYAAKLGGEAALSGVIVGMTPIASIASAVLYSWWANRSYKAPLIFATVCLVIGNLMYALALPYNSIALAITGRLLNGFGGARAINRRYIADNYSRQERTQASAMFVTSSALGMAAGPAMAAALDYIPDFEWQGLVVTVETLPGWVMFVLWVIYLFATIFAFEEPDRLERERIIEHRRSTYALESSNSHSHSLETTPLKGVQSAETSPSLSSLWYNVPVVATLIIYVVLKLVLECLIVGSTTIAEWYFQWSSTTSGFYLAALGLLMFPTNLLVGYLSYRYEDRELILLSEYMMLAGVAAIISYGHYTRFQFILGGVIIFISTNVLEGVNMALLSKTIPRHFAKGTFNSGLLATEAGTTGRALGDIAISVVGLPGVQYVLNWTFVPLVFLCLLTILFTWRNYAKLTSHD